MTAILTTGSSLTCAHGGRISLSSHQSKLSVAGHPVLVQTDLVGASISGCPTPVASSPTTKPCLTVVAVLAGPTPKLTVDGTPVLLANARGLTDGVDPAPGTWSVQSAAQTKATVS